MSNYLKIYDFFLSHNQSGTNTTFFKLAVNHPSIIPFISSDGNVSESIQRQVVFDGFLRKFSNDLNNEILKNDHTKKIVKKSRDYNGTNSQPREVQKDYTNKNLFGILHAGKITNNSTLEKRNENNGTEELTESDFEHTLLNGQRIYDDFFFLLHLSFECNVARLFVLTRRDNINVDTILKKYLKDNLFKATGFKKTKAGDFVSENYKNAVLGRSIVSSINISKAETIISESDGIEYEVEIRLKPKTQSVFSQVTQTTVNLFKKSKVYIEEEGAEDENSEIKFNIKDPDTKIRKTVSFGSQENFTPRLVFNDDEVLDDNQQIDIDKLKAICMEYIVYENNQLI
ncbi:hypothetical protein D3C87_32110 [compost metagenome]